MFSFITVVVFYVVLGWVGYKAPGKAEVQYGYESLNKGSRIPQPLRLLFILVVLYCFCLWVGVIKVVEYVSEKIDNSLRWLRKVTVKA